MGNTYFIETEFDRMSPLEKIRFCKDQFYKEFDYSRTYKYIEVMEKLKETKKHT